MEIHKTKGIVLRTTKYGDTSVIAAIYTELFGLQSYMIKGVRQSTKKSQGKANYFQPAAMLEMEVYHHEQKQLQFIKEYQWAYLYQHVLFDVTRNAVALFVIELLQHVLKQPEANPELFYLIEDTLKQVDTGSNALVGNLPLYFSLHLGGELGFQVQGEYTASTPVLDLQEGLFLAEKPLHAYYVDGEQAKQLSQIANIQFYNDLENILLNREIRQQLLQHLLQYMKLHVPDFGELKSLPVLQSVLA